jgi:hypothetical protein
VALALNLFRDIFPAARCVLLICFLSTTNTPQLAAGIFYCQYRRCCPCCTLARVSAWERSSGLGKRPKWARWRWISDMPRVWFLVRSVGQPAAYFGYLGRQRSGGRPIAMAALALRALQSGRAALGQLQRFWFAPTAVVPGRLAATRKPTWGLILGWMEPPPPPPDSLQYVDSRPRCCAGRERQAAN